MLIPLKDGLDLPSERTIDSFYVPTVCYIHNTSDVWIEYVTLPLSQRVVDADGPEPVLQATIRLITFNLTLQN